MNDACDQAVTDETLELEFSTANVSANDTDLIDRILAAYRYTAPLFSGHGDSMWGELSGASKTEQLILRAGDTEDAAQLLRYPANNNLLFGFDEANISHLKYHETRNEASRDLWARRILYRLIRLAEAVGTARMYNPENNMPPAKFKCEVLISALDKTFGFKVDFPNPYPGEYGLKTTRGIADHRSLIALYCAWRLSTLAKGNAKILEIGAGVGRVAYYARKFGLTNYTIVDLPHTNVAQANFLGRVLDPSLLVLANEKDDPDRDDRIRIYSPEWFFDSFDEFDVVLNCDSFTEIDARKAALYFFNIAHRARFLLSINHERNKFRVCGLPIDTGVTPRRHLRFPFWLRSGYVEELFYFTDK